LSRRFFKLFPEERPAGAAEGNLNEVGKTVAWLPRPELLPESSQKALQDLFSTDTSQLTRQLSNRLNSAQFDNSLSQPARREINRALSRIQQHQGVSRRAFRFGMDAATLAAPAIAALELSHMGVNSMLIYLAAMNLSARPFHMVSERLRDGFLKRRLNEWYHRMQYATTMDFIGKSVTQDLQQSLVSETEAKSQLEAIQKAQRALKFLNPDYRVIDFQD
jgi:hypothetical protein